MRGFQGFSVVNMIAVLLIPVGAWANNDSKPGIHPGGPGKAIDWEELKARCAHPEQFDVQRAPQNIVIQCTDKRLTWTAYAPGEIPLPGRRKVITAVFADKFFVNAEKRDVPLLSKSGSCHRFKEVEETLTVERPLTCAEILGMKGDPADLCVSTTDAAKGSNPKLIAVRDTGLVHDTCSGSRNGHPKNSDGN